MEQSRRNFIQKATLGIAGAVSLPFINEAATQSNNFVAKQGDLLPVGIAGYTFNKFDLEKSIAMMKRIGVQNLSLKEFHLPINSSDEKVKSVMAQFAAANINVYAVGVIYMKTKQAVDDAFAYAKKVGVKLIVGVPNYDLIDYTEQKVKETDISIAIHNHGPEDALYPGPQQVYDRIKDKDSRMGLCLDIGHAQRAGTDLVKAIKDYRGRLYDLHIKDVSLAQKEGKAIEIGRGVIDFNAVVKALKKNNFKGMCSIEFEKDMSDPLAGMAESIGYFRGVMSTFS
ncbi:sugar phosphate isomerase/epimerase [Segetibacter sp.]|jgi:sugar phosphate isomerase/epimerase|uniref:sugar phosphate isomerase/epimerase family protein n=1 Tax=Segetibacter sp. TaxID=2231182 RepID=UPI002638184B|nr:sugar phosphate isomerase/epimerase [Segetibacter sp.]MCW3079518.1 sugar phosphate isomerase/epimerase [Segetibacter sp.]